MVALAKLTADGDGVAKDLAKSVTLLETAIATSDEVAGPAHLGLADIYRGNPDIAAEPDLALKNYVLAAEAGEGRGHLLAGEIIAATVPFGAEESEATARHFTEAARMIDVDTVTKAMFGLKSVALYATVQRMLVDRGYRIGTIDGVLGPQTVSSIKKFCADQSVASCSGLVVGYDLLKALLSAAPAG
jgi:TPR repeat protein